ncbi:LUD domain-containing protein [Halomarina litorea]|uniref:LUD domain-containing protein n=1 Tax=Halomarina litorea TaxID=2961595 RepID=UPI0020C5971C|nr:LUD domain-containing protein [Halomarina sp. BCD28]
MSSSPVSAFQSSLDGLDVGWTETDAAGFPAALDAVLDSPAVGAPLPFEGVELPDSVDTDPTPAALREAATGVTPVEFAIADYGSVVIRAEGNVEPVSLYADTHVAVLDERDVLPDMPAAFERFGPLLRDGESAIVATGPSATADMGDLVRGAHGPKDVHVVVLTSGDEAGTDGDEGGADR